MSNSRQKGGGRASLKRHHVLQELRRRIASGELAPGARLPTRRDLECEFQTSLITIQEALTQLAREGAVQARGRQGTFITPHPPHLFTYALIFPKLPDDGGWSRFWTALANEAMREQQSGPRAVRPCYGIDGHAENEQYQALVRDVHAHCLAGLVFASNPFLLRGTPLLEEPGIARVAIMSHPLPDNPDILAVGHNGQSFIDKALDYLAQRRRRRIAVIGAMPMNSEFAISLAAGIAARNMVSRPYWTQGASRETAYWARNAAHLLMHPGQQERPDGLIIHDDNLVEYATAGLIDAGVRVPEDVDVVAHCNFPWPTPSVLPVQRLGYDAGECLRTCLELISRKRQGHAVDPVTLLPARWAKETLQVGQDAAEGGSSN